MHSSASRVLLALSLIICLIGILLRAWATGTLKSEDIMDKKLVTNQLVYHHESYTTCALYIDDNDHAELSCGAIVQSL